MLRKLILCAMLIVSVAKGTSQNRFFVGNQERYIDTAGILHKPFLNNGTRAVILIGTSIILNAIGDGLNDSQHKAMGHACNALSTVALISLPIFTRMTRHEGLYLFVGYSLIRFSTFNYIYNATRGLPLSYTGTTSYPDIWYNKFEPTGMAIFKTITFTVGITICLDELN